MTEYILSIDPGKSTGIALVSYDPDQPPKLVEAWQFGGGVLGFLKWSEENWESGYYDYEWSYEHPSGLRHPTLRHETLATHEVTEEGYDPETDEEIETVAHPKVLTVISEKFQPINHANYALTTDSVEPLRVEGALIALEIMPDYDVSEKRWRIPNAQYIAGGTGKSEKKKRLHAFLKSSGFYVTGKTLGAPDADDARSAIGHALGYLAKELHHKPSFDLLTEWSNA